MRFAWMTLLTAALAAGPLAADVVYLRDGTAYEGRVVDRDDKHVTIDVRGKGLVRLRTEDVLHVSVVASSASTRPAGAASGGGTAAIEDLREKPFTPEMATRPETVVFQLMRKLKVTPPGTDSYAIRKQIEQWRIATHDRLRRSDGDWIGPDEFARRRAAYETALREAQAIAKQYSSYRYRSDREKERKRAEYLAAMEKVRQAAQKWPDPLLREYLVGLANLVAEDGENAAANLRRCVAKAPRVAGFRQAYGLALIELEQHADALAELITVVHLWPGSRDALELLEDGLKEAPGGLMKHDNFVAAKDTLARYEDLPERRYKRRGWTWLMPGRAWYVSDHDFLPVPPYDRLVFRQGAAVPIGNHTVLVDARVIKGAEEVFVRLGPKTVVAGRVRRLSYRGLKDADVPLSFVSLDGYQFTPIKFKAGEGIAAGDVVTAYGLGFYEQMGRGVRRMPTTVKSVREDGTPELGESLLPGEAAAPILTEDGRLVGFLSGKTNVSAEDGGPDEYIPPETIRALIERAQRGSSQRRPYGRARRREDLEPQEVTGDVFVVYATETEKLD